MVTFDILRPVTKTELAYLEKLYKNNYDKTTYHYLSIYNQIKWNEYFDRNNVNSNSKQWKMLQRDFYTHRNGNFQEFGTYLSIYKDVKDFITFFTLEDSMNELKECLENTKLIDWASGPILPAVSPNMVSLIKDVSFSNGGVLSRIDDCFCFSIGNKYAKDLKELRLMMPDFRIASLTEENAKYVHSKWDIKDENTVEFVQGLIQLNKSLGIFKTDTNELVAWIIQMEYRGIGILQVMPEYRKNGFATVLVTKLTKEIVNLEDIDVVGFTFQANFRSQNLLLKLGYKKICDIKWMNFKNMNLNKINENVQT